MAFSAKIYYSSLEKILNVVQKSKAEASTLTVVQDLLIFTIQFSPKLITSKISMKNLPVLTNLLYIYHIYYTQKLADQILLY
jgi:hypothetical protein